MAVTKKELSFEDDLLQLLERKAESSGVGLDDYVNSVLKHNLGFGELSDEYKKEVDLLLKKEAAGNLKFLSKEEFKSRLRERKV